MTAVGAETAPDLTEDDRATWPLAEDMIDPLLVPGSSFSEAQADVLVPGRAATATGLGV